MMAASNSTPANDDFHRLLLVVKDLAQQLDENKQATTKLKLHADLLKEQLQAYKLRDSTPNQTRPSLAKANTIDDLLDEREDLLRKNEKLRQENQELADLLKDYERGLESATEAIRDHAYQESVRTSQIHQAYNEKLNFERMENVRLQQCVFEAEARLLKVSGLLRQAYAADHEADRNVDRALLDLQTQNSGLRQALGLPVNAPVDLDKDLVFAVDDKRTGESKEG